MTNSGLQVRPLNGVLVANAKQEVDNHWAHDTQHHHTDVHIGEEEGEVQTSSPWGRWLLILLVRIARMPLSAFTPTRH